ncbi:MAG: response regulator [Candidatus Glassbacteria bacterium]|nr:response regulator [Candidatus Glassbacteria bacterium]
MEKKAKAEFIPDAPLSTGDIAHYCHTTVMQVNRWIKSKSLKAFRNPGGQYRINKRDFKRFLESNGMPVIDEFFQKTSGKKILVADDDRTVVAAISYLLRAHSPDFEVEAAGDGYEALIKAGDYKPDLMILDIRMPKIDGLEICRRLRQNPQITSGIKILAITGHSEAYNRDLVIASGADEYLLKPFDKETLLKMVDELIG